MARLAARAGEGGTTLTELADTLVRDEGLPFAKAHRIAAQVMASRAQAPNVALSQALAAASKDVFGHGIVYDERLLESPARSTSLRFARRTAVPRLRKRHVRWPNRRRFSSAMPRRGRGAAMASPTPNGCSKARFDGYEPHSQHYVRIILVWALTLASLYAFQQ